MRQKESNIRYSLLLVYLAVMLPIKLGWFAHIHAQVTLLVLIELAGFVMAGVGLMLALYRHINLLLVCLALGIYGALSFLILANSLYFRFYGGLMPIAVFKMAHMAPKIHKSVLALVKPEDTLFLIDIAVLPLLAFAAIRMRRKNISDRVPSMIWRRRFTAGLIITGAIFLSARYFQMHKNFSVKAGQGSIAYWTASSIIYHYFSDITGESRRVVARLFRPPAPYPEWLRNNRKESFESRKGPTLSDKRPNFILIEMESLMPFVIGKKIGGQEITPSINRLIREGVYFENFTSISGVGSTSDSEVATLFSLYPIINKIAVNEIRNNQNLHSLVAHLKKQGWYTVAMHGNQRSFWNRSLTFGKLGFDRFFSEENYRTDELIGWGLGDESFFMQSFEKLDSLAPPFFAFLITLTGHHPYEFPKEKKTAWIKGDNPETIDYLNVVHYVDKSLGKFIKRLKTLDNPDGNVIIIFGDHPVSFEKDDLASISPAKDGVGKVLAELKAKFVPMVIHAPSYLKPRVVKDYCSQIDIAPTILGLLGIFDPTFLGRDLFNDREEKFLLYPFGKDGLQLVFRDMLCTGQFSSGFKTCRFLKTEETLPVPGDIDRFVDLLKYSNDVFFYDVDRSKDLK